MRMWSRNATLALAATCAAFAGGEAPAQSTNYKLQIVNRCDRTIYVARRVKTFSGAWTTRGWIVVRAGQTRTSLLNSANRIFYLYAVSADRKISWHGYRRPNSVRRPVVMRRFTHTSGPIDAAEVIFVHFHRKTIPPGKIGFRQTYLCRSVARGGSAGRQGGGRDPGGGADRLPEIGPRPDNGGQGGGRSGGGTDGGNSSEGGGRSEGGQGGGTQLGGIPAALGQLRGRSVWIRTKSVPTRDYCALMNRAGMTVRCQYERHTSSLHVVILRCPDHDEGHALALKRYLGLADLPSRNRQGQNRCGQFNEITIYVNR